jgi:hypothetical protein
MAFTMEFGTGFEMGQVPVRAGVLDNSGCTIESTTTHTGSYAAKATNYGYTIVRSGSTEVYVGAWVRFSAYLDRYPSIFMKSGGTAIAELRWVDPHWDAYVGGVLVASGTVGVLLASTWCHVQIHFKCADAGNFDTVIDGVPDITYPGDTKPAALDSIDEIQFKASGTTATIRMDDIAIGTGGWPGDIRFDAVLINGDSSAAWSRSTGADNYALLDEVPPSGVDYVYTTADAADLYTTPGTWDDTDGLGNVVKDPIAVTVWSDARKQDGNTDDKLSETITEGANTIQNASPESLLTSYENRWFTAFTAPDGTEWDKNHVNAMIVGIDADMA